MENGQETIGLLSPSRTVADSVGAPRISLCMICGNEESVILKCLESAKSAFDELCLVQAIGEQEEDDTFKVAWKWCLDNKKRFRFGIYRNKVAGLKHVDDFGAARNQSFELALSQRAHRNSTASDWLLWLDCDDYLDDINCGRIREAVATCPDQWNALFCRYRVESEGAVISRERLIRACGRPRWKNAVHETCTIEGKTGDCPQIEVFHADHTAKHESSAARNLSILTRVTQDAGRHHFYLHTDLKTMGRSEESLRAGHAALALLAPDQVEERYLILLNLSELEPERRRERLLEAVGLQPHRREAFAYLVQLSLINGHRSDAISFFRLMDSLPVPSPVPWTHQGIWYNGWARHFLRVRVLRAAGKHQMAQDDYWMHWKASEEFRKGAEAWSARNGFLDFGGGNPDPEEPKL